MAIPLLEEELNTNSVGLRPLGGGLVAVERKATRDRGGIKSYLSLRGAFATWQSLRILVGGSCFASRRGVAEQRGIKSTLKADLDPLRYYVAILPQGGGDLRC